MRRASPISGLSWGLSGGRARAVAIRDKMGCTWLATMLKVSLCNGIQQLDAP